VQVVRGIGRDMGVQVKILGLSACVVAMVVAGDVNARTMHGYTTGEQVLNYCRAFRRLALNNWQGDPADSRFAGICDGMVKMVSDSYEASGADIPPTAALPAFCIPDNTNSNALGEQVALWGDQHPEKRSLGGYWFIREALAAAWPCNN
jgi:Rap1a immunity proteins